MSHAAGGWYLIAAGIVMAAVGLTFWFPAAAMQGSKLRRSPLVVATVVFGHAPDSWVPWGLAFALGGVGIVAGQPIEDALAALSLVSLSTGAYFLIRPPRWARDRAIHVYLRELGIDRRPRT